MNSPRVFLPSILASVRCSLIAMLNTLRVTLPWLPTWASAFATALAIAAQVGRAQDASADPFRGNSLAGWTTLDGGPVTTGWEASDGEIRLNRAKGRGGHIVTVAEFDDFDLSFDWKIAERGNSGLKYRVRKFGNQTLGCEYQICDETPGRPLNKRSAGALYDLYEPNPDRLLKAAGQWNHARIVVRGERIEHWLNGRLIVSAIVNDEDWQKRIAESKFVDVEEFGRNRTGRIMLTDHGSDVAYRNFVFQPLKETTFERDVRPILKKHCFQCHGEGKAESGLDVRLAKLILKGGESGPAVSPGKQQESLLLKRLKAGEMPPETIHLRPSAAEIETIARWVDGGAKTARPEPDDPSQIPRITEEDRSHWSFQPIRRPLTPHSSSSVGLRSPVDAFIAERLADVRLSLSPEADRATLVRRLSFDLVGLPPTPENVEACAADERPDWYERLVDRLLASPHYGERWGRHWLDVAGYADSEGYNDTDAVREEAFRYRDYVIRSFNGNKPLDQFVIEQLAGDELLAPPYKNLSPDQAEILAATGFLRMAPDGTGGSNPDQIVARNDVIAETLKIVSTSLLGLTVGCAQCHDHRYDPILQTDYYRLRAVFEPAFDVKNWREPRRRLISLLNDDERATAAEIEKRAQAAEAELKVKLKEFQAWVFERELEQVPTEQRDAARDAGLTWQADRSKLSNDQKKLLDDYPSLKVAAAAGPLNLFLEKYKRAGDLKDVVDASAKQAAAIRAKKPKELFVRALTEPTTEPPTTHVFLRGNHTTPGPAVSPGDLSVLASVAADLPVDDPNLPTTGRRLAFARQLTSGTHPLLSRVLANRVWLHHFGRGIVDTAADFGTQGDRPTHPKLLDWLASELASSAWDLKHLHRQIVGSHVYRQSSAANTDAEAIDAANTLLWRAPVRRLEAEIIRDAMLATSGQLQTQMFGPPVPVSADSNNQIVVGGGSPSASAQEFRRSAYVQVRRSSPPHVLHVFDSPQMEPNCEQRNASTVAPQSLLMLNSQFVVGQSEALAARVQALAAGNQAAQIAAAYGLVLGRVPSSEEQSELVDFLKTQADLIGSRLSDAEKPQAAQRALASLCQALFASNPFLYVD
jgi:hypothetical protein